MHMRSVQTFLTSKWRRYSNILWAGNGICNLKYKRMFLKENKYNIFIIFVYLYQIYCIWNHMENNIKIVSSLRDFLLWQK